MRFALVTLFVSLAGPVAGASPTVIAFGADQPVHVESLSAVIQLLEDPTGAVDIAAVSAADAAFVPGSPEKTNMGFSASAWWVRLTLRNTGAASRFVYLRQGYPLIDSLELFEPHAGGWKRHATGDRRPFASREVEARDFLFPLTIPAGVDTTLYLRYASQGPIDINLSLLDPNELAGSLSHELLAYGVYFGAVFMLLVWSGLVFFAVRDGAFLAYFAYVATFGVYMLVNTGFAYQFLWPTSPRWGNTALIVLLNLALVTALQFSTNILRAKDYAPRLDRIARGLQLLAGVGIALSPFMAYSVLVRPVTLLILVGVVFLITLGIVCLLAGSRPARFFVIAWGAFLSGSVVFVLKNFGLVPHTFMTQHSWQLGALLEMILLSMTLSSRMNELKHQSRTDSLTLLGNRRLFDDRLPAEFAAARSSGQPLSLLMLDIDHFKQYNDKHGHAQGDEVIKKVGAVLRRYARKPSLACRYGGEEFCVILPACDAATAAVVAERLRAAVEMVGAGTTGMTISVGYATQTGDYSTADKLFDAADAALYSAKEAGRNRVAPFHGRREDDPPTAGVPGATT